MPADHREPTTREAVVQDGARNYYSLPVASQRVDLFWQVDTNFLLPSGEDTKRTTWKTIGAISRPWFTV